jgi:acetyl esterase/lipase
MALQMRMVVMLGTAVATLTGCSGATLLNAVIPSSGYELQRNLAYGPAAGQSLDLYVPRAPWRGPGPRPTVMFVYGGSWETGSKGIYKFAAEALVSQGWVAVIPDYRKYPAVRWPVFVEDCAAAAEWTARHSKDWGGDPGHVLAMGHSAGAHIVTLLALDPRYARLMPTLPSFAGVIGLSGPYDFLPLTGPTVRKIFATADDLQLTQPIHFADHRAAPMLLMHGDDDDTVWPRNTSNLAQALRAAGSAVEEIHYPGVDHLRMVVALARPFRSHYRVLEDIAAFVASPGTVHAPRQAAGELTLDGDAHPATEGAGPS